MTSLPRVSVLLLALVIFPAHSKDRLTTTYRNLHLGIEFQKPSTLKVHGCGAEQNCIWLRSPGSKNGIEITVIEANLEKSVRAVASGFELVGGQWIKHGRYTAEPAETMTSAGSTVIYGDGDCLVDDDQGTHTSTCTEAFITNGQRSAHLEGSAYVAGELFQVLRTFRFLAQRANE
jgi:hypothetical protein